MVPIDSAGKPAPDARVVDALAADDSSKRLHAALAVGTHPDPALVDVLVARCGVEPDFFVRDMLTWALTRLPPETTVPRLLVELDSTHAQARSQALHTLSKIGDRSAWPAITRALLRDADDTVARTAWRAAVVLVPDAERSALATELASQFGRGDREVQLSLSQALVSLADVVEPVLEVAVTHRDPAVRAHARATERLLSDPDAGFGLAVDEAKRVVALGPDREGTPGADR
ncbi:HEAT repeat domain-containing protein [Micromonospora craniellae]|uniref:HEAT repeat domain-containing protein n=1 Tax=Micromonospora craniellae TaxID=2294034 RepID=A0A372FYW1_9ACTN|nr:HEAT repeat domain-containing protein [Micromonospora craniellae]QOC93769.1 HEAT repeat domain-containing protein [Micromonospora craniellae]RFS45679.1 HEAT repeat domain-containing protein [Micromonospora craniellae]